MIMSRISMTTKTKMTSEIHKIQGLIDKYSQIMDDYDYIQICNSLKKIHDVKDTIMNSPEYASTCPLPNVELTWETTR